jgi:hypothetical protein
MKRLAGLLFVLSLGLPAAAHAQAGPNPLTIGQWQIDGKDGDCYAIARQGATALLIFSPAADGTNRGGAMLANKNWAVTDGDVVLDIAGTASWAGRRNGTSYSDVPGYWFPFNDAYPAAGYPDAWTLNVRLGGIQLINLELLNFKAAWAAVLACHERTKPAG